MAVHLNKAIILFASSAIFGNKIKVNFWITYEILYEIDMRIKCSKFLDGHHSANFVYVRKFVEN